MPVSSLAEAKVGTGQEEEMTSSWQVVIVVLSCKEGATAYTVAPTYKTETASISHIGGVYLPSGRNRDILPFPAGLGSKVEAAGQLKWKPFNQ